MSGATLVASPPAPSHAAVLSLSDDSAATASSGLSSMTPMAVEVSPVPVSAMPL